MLIAGHGRLRAAKQLGLTEVPVIELAGLSEAQKKALRLADNKIALNAGWDLEILKLELDELGTLDVDFDLSLTGFSSGEIDVCSRLPMIPMTRSSRPFRPSPKTELGDIWILGRAPASAAAMGATWIPAAGGRRGRSDRCRVSGPALQCEDQRSCQRQGRHREFAMASGEMSDG